MHLYLRPLPYVLAAFFTLLLTGCNKVDETVICQLSLSETSAVFDMNGGVSTISVNPFPENEVWDAEYVDVQDWFTFTKSGSDLNVHASSNHSTDPRSGRIRLFSPTDRFEPYEVSVLQEAAQPLSFSTTAADHACDSEGGEFTFPVVSNYDWSVTSDSQWLSVDVDKEAGKVKVSARANASEESLSAVLTVSAAEGSLKKTVQYTVTQGTRAENPYFRLLGQWEITAAKWYYSPNGSLNNLDYNPNQTDYYLIFDLEEGEYGKTFIMKDFLYPGTSLEVRYDKESGNIVIPFGWTVLSYDVFLYITLVGDTSFSYASYEVEAVPSSDFSQMMLDLPSVSGFNHIGFGLWTYNDSGKKVAFGSRSRPTMFPMGPIVFRKQ